jgi:hypothetical protein
LAAALSSYISLGWVDGIGVDLSGPTAKLDVVADSSDNVILLSGIVPNPYEGVPVEITVVNTYDPSGEIVSADF